MAPSLEWLKDPVTNDGFPRESRLVLHQRDNCGRLAPSTGGWTRNGRFCDSDDWPLRTTTYEKSDRHLPIPAGLSESSIED